MLLIEKNKSLKNYNTFHINETADKYVLINNESDLLNLIKENKNEHFKILGGGSNILLTQQVAALVIHNKIEGIEIIKETNDYTEVKFMSGTQWHDCVLWAVKNNLGGIENLSLIPGTVGAAPIQNIGAYGVELKEVLISLEAIELKSGVKKIFSKNECEFGYRDSIFKNILKDQFFILCITLKLLKNPIYKIEYGDIKKTLQDDFKNIINLKNISDTIIKIRKSKLPDPELIGNAGSFFKNPIIENSQYESLLKNFPNMPSYKVTEGIKIPAAWLIEQCNLKGFKNNNCGVHPQHALVLVNLNEATGADIFTLSKHIITKVHQLFNITLVAEVNIW